MITARTAGFAALAAALAGCSSSKITQIAVTGGRSRTIDAQMHVEIDITLGTVGPGAYASPPAISAPVVNYLGVEEATTNTPAGPVQTFRFMTVAPGTAIIDFVNTTQSLTVEDTVVVQGPAT